MARTKAATRTQIVVAVGEPVFAEEGNPLEADIPENIQLSLEDEKVSPEGHVEAVSQSVPVEKKKWVPNGQKRVIAPLGWLVISKELGTEKPQQRHGPYTYDQAKEKLSKVYTRPQYSAYLRQMTNQDMLDKAQRIKENMETTASLEETGGTLVLT